MNAAQGFPAGLPEFGMRASDSVFTDGQYRMAQGVYVNHDLEDSASICGQNFFVGPGGKTSS